jgi:hypothetical protein
MMFPPEAEKEGSGVVFVLGSKSEGGQLDLRMWTSEESF